MSDATIKLQQSEWTKNRRLCLGRLCDEANLQKLRDMPGVISANNADEKCLEIIYDLRQTSLFHLEQALHEMGFDFTPDLFESIKFAVYRYTEHIQIKNRVLDTGWDVWVRDVYLNEYRDRQHGRRDLRVQQWRKYVKDPGVTE